MNTLIMHTYQFQAACCQRHDKALKSGIQINQDCHLIHISRGSGVIHIGSESCPLRRGTVIAPPPYTPFWFEIEPVFVMYNFHYLLHLPDGTRADESFRLPPCFRPRHFARIEKRMQRICRLCRQKGAQHVRAETETHALTIDYYLTQPLQRTAGTGLDPRLEKLRLWLNTPERDRFSADEAAKVCALSVSQMNRLFLRTFGKSPHDYWELRRFTLASDRLLHSNMTLKQLSASLGFNDPAYFNRWFRKMAHRPPARYRAEKGLIL